jgi:hypothetical protein
MKKNITRFLALGALAAAALAFQAPARAEEKAPAPPQEKRELLSMHETVAVFEGVRAHRCMGRTALCPDNCGDSGTLAVFKIAKYLKYEKPGQYGDAKANRYQFMTADNKGNKKIGDEMFKTVSGLKPGDVVLLSWRHDYVTQNGCSFPERTVTFIKKLTPEEAAPLLKGVPPASLKPTPVPPAAPGNARGPAMPR